MDELVDIFYYDYVLYKLAELGIKGGKPETITHYQKIAQKLLLKLRSDKVKMDAEVGLKFAFIKIKDLVQTVKRCALSDNVGCCKVHLSNFLTTSHDYLTKIVDEYPSLTSEKSFNKLYELNVKILVYSVGSYENFNRGNLITTVISETPIATALKNIKSTKDYLIAQSELLSSLNIDEQAYESKKTEKLYKVFSEELHNIFLDLKYPLLEYFANREMFRLKDLYPITLDKITQLPDNPSDYNVKLITDYKELCIALSKTKDSVINPTDEGVKIDWSNTSIHPQDK